MSLLPRILLGLAWLGLGTGVARAAPGWVPAPDPHTALILANVHGDSVWFESEVFEPGLQSALGPPDSLLRAIMPRVSSKGLALVVATHPAQGTWEPDSALLGHLASVGLSRCMSSVFPEPTRSPAVYEPGCFQDLSMRWPCGWVLQFRMGPRPTWERRPEKVRLTFIVVGRPVPGRAARRGWADAPMPISGDRRVRPYDLTSDDVRATARILGEVIVDFDRELLLPQRVEGCSVTMRAARQW